MPKVKEEWKIYGEVFSEATIMTLAKLQHEYFDELLGPISTGKEANVFLATSRLPLHKLVALKIYRFETSDFKNMWQYVRGDVRFERVGKTKRGLVYAWAQKEYSNLMKAYKAGVRVPKPIKFEKNVLVMEFIGKGGVPAKTAKEQGPKNPAQWYKTILKFMGLLYQKESLIHADLSEYNVLNNDEEAVLIDWGQGVLASHPMAERFLLRDIKNVNKYFKSLGVKTKTDGQVEKVVKKKWK